MRGRGRLLMTPSWLGPSIRERIQRQPRKTRTQAKSCSFSTAGRAGEFAHQFYSQGSSTLSVKPGRYRIRVLKGFEYSVAKQQVTVRSAETTETTVRLKRWINMSDKDWYSADAHIHIGRQFKELDGALCQWMQAEDVRVSPNVTFF